jgi:phage-related protein
MANWPSIAAPTYSTSGRVRLQIIRTPFEAGYVQRRKVATVAKEDWNLVWANMSEADFQTLRTFFKANQGMQIDNWTEPVTGTVWSVAFVSDSLEWSHSNKGHRAVQVAIEEI